jgi:hypothetical protein
MKHIRSFLALFLAFSIAAAAPIQSAQAFGLGKLGSLGTVQNVTPSDDVPFTTNLNRGTTSKILAGYQAMLAGTRNMVIAIMGDSTERGVDETASPAGSQYPLSIAEQLAILFRSDGIAAGANNWYGISGFNFPDYTGRDSRVAATGSATAFVTAVPVQGGSELEFPTAAGTWSFTPQQPVSSCQIYYQDSTAGRQFSWDVDGGAATTITTVGANTIASATISLGSVGTHTIRLTWVAAFVRIYGIDCQDATRKEVTIRQWAISGGTTSNMIENTGTPSSGRLRQMDLYRPDVVAGDYGIVNSWRLSRSVANVVLDLTTLFDAIKADGADFIFVEPPFDSSSTGNAAIQQQYVDAAAALAISKGGIVFRTRAALTSKTVSDSYGYTVQADAVHYRIYGESFRAALMKPMFRYGMGLTPFQDWIVDTAGTTFDFANGRMYVGGAQDTLANDSQNHLVSLRSQSNIHPYSGSLLAGVNWGAIGLGASGTGVVGPDGAATAFKVVEDGSLGRHLLFGNGAGAATLPIPADSVITIGCTLKAAEDGFAILNGLDNTGANGFYASVNLTTGAVASTGSGLSGTAGTGATFVYATSTDRGNGWWTFSVTGKLPAAATALYPGLDLSNALGANNYQGVPGNGIYASSCNAVVNQTGLIPTASVGLETSAQPSAQLFGTSWELLPQTGDNSLRLSGGALTNAAVSGQQAGYLTFNQNAGQNVSRIGATWKFTNVGAGSNGAATLVVWKTHPISTGAPPDAGVHLAIGRSGWIFGKILSGNPVVTVASGTFSPALAYDTPLTVDVSINGTTATVSLPDGTTQDVTDADISAAAGPWATIEAFQNDAAADDRIGFYKSWLK